MRTPQDLHEAAAVNRNIVGVEDRAGGFFQGIDPGRRLPDETPFRLERDRPGVPFKDRGRQFDGLEDLLIAGAAAKMGLESGFNFLAAGPWVLIEQGLGAKDQTRRAEPALNGPGLDKGQLQGLGLVGGA